MLHPKMLVPMSRKNAIKIVVDNNIAFDTLVFELDLLKSEIVAVDLEKG